jgi:hypothetical protein
VDVVANFSYPVAAQVSTPFNYLAVGPDYVLAYHFDWKAPNQVGSVATADVAYTLYHREYNGTVLSNASICNLRSPVVGVNTSTGIVGSTVNYSLQYYPIHAQPVAITWDGKQIGTVLTTNYGSTGGSFAVPASPMGTHSVHWKYGHWDTHITFTVKPRIKVSPSSNVARGSTVNVSLRGYAKYETVSIRWKKGTSYVKVASVTTSSTGSANIDVKVPAWVPNGGTSVRGDGTYGHAQTNSVTVSGGAPLTSSAVKPATPTATATSTPIPQPTETPATVEATPAAPSATPTETASPFTETPAAGETATPEPSPSVTAEPTDTPSPTEEPSTPAPTEAVEATATP